jgi:demethylmenaquinone methyltransferase/2-methoxy-6-polyprenyl-1,4-benzoquinol methylase
MFERIAPRYDLLNRLMSLGLDQRWRAQTLSSLGVGAGDRVLDVACGTGDLARLATERGAHVVALDFAAAMLRRAQQRGVADHLVNADAVRMPLVDGWASVVVCGFALRNFVSIQAVLREMARVLAPGGRIGLLEIGWTERSWLRAGHKLYFEQLVPRLGALLSDGAAYAYLPRSVSYLPPEAEFLSWLAKAGFTSLRRERLRLGMTQVFTGVRA